MDTYTLEYWNGTETVWDKIDTYPRLDDALAMVWGTANKRAVPFAIMFRAGPYDGTWEGVGAATGKLIYRIIRNQ